MEVVVSADSSGQLWNCAVFDLHSGTNLLSYRGGNSSSRSLTVLNGEYILGAQLGKNFINVWEVQRKVWQRHPKFDLILNRSWIDGFSLLRCNDMPHMYRRCTLNLLTLVRVNVIHCARSENWCVTLSKRWSYFLKLPASDFVVRLLLLFTFPCWCGVNMSVVVVVAVAAAPPVALAAVATV